MVAPPNTVIAGKYRLGARIGSGGMGAVYEAEQVELRKRVAIKLVAPEHGAKPEVLGRFRRESRAASRAESEHIVQVFDCGHDEEHGYFLVMEYLRGEDLGSRLRREGRLPLPLALSIAMQAARGLAKAHDAGVIHRDLKPGNVFLVEREEETPLVKLVDFGISKIFEEQLSTQLTKAGTVIGTVQYMSPEQARGETVDARTDLFALGAVIFEMLAGEPPLATSSTVERMLVDLVNGQLRDLGSLCPELPADVLDIVRATLAGDRLQRTPSARVLAKLLAAAFTQATGDRPSVLGVRRQPIDSEPPTERTAFEPASAAHVVSTDTNMVSTPRASSLPPSAFEPRSDPTLDPNDATETMHARDLALASLAAPPLPRDLIASSAPASSTLPEPVKAPPVLAAVAAPAPAPRRAAWPWMLVAALAALVALFTLRSGLRASAERGASAAAPTNGVEEARRVLATDPARAFELAHAASSSGDSAAFEIEGLAALALHRDADAKRAFEACARSSAPAAASCAQRAATLP